MAEDRLQLIKNEFVLFGHLMIDPKDVVVQVSQLTRIQNIADAGCGL